MKLDSRDFTCNAPFSVCLPSAQASFSFWPLFRLYIACMDVSVYRHGDIPSAPSWQIYSEIFGNLSEMFAELKDMVQCHFCSESHRITAASAKKWDLRMVPGQLLPDCGTCTFLSGRGPCAMFQSKRASKTELWNTCEKCSLMHSRPQKWGNNLIAANVEFNNRPHFEVSSEE